MNKLNLLLAIPTICLFVGCSNSPLTSFPELDEILDPTETTLEQRTPEWFKEQTSIRGKTLSACFNYFNNKANLIGGDYQIEFNENIFSKYIEMDDCMNAQKGEMLHIAESGSLVFEHQLNNLEEHLNSEQIRAEVDRAAQQVAQELDNLKNSNNESDKLGKSLVDKIAGEDSPDDE